MAINVLLADDHAVVLDGMKALLEAEKDIFVVAQAANGREAVRKARKHRPDLVIMDISMPELNGIEATKQIIEDLPDIRVIMLSMHASSEHILRSLQAGARGYLLKDSAGQEVVKAVRSVSKGIRYLSQRISETLIEDYINRSEFTIPENPLDQLSGREREILQLVVEGKTSAEISTRLYLSPKTVDTYRSRIIHKLKVKGLPGLIKFAIRHGITSLED